MSQTSRTKYYIRIQRKISFFLLYVLLCTVLSVLCVAQDSIQTRKLFEHMTVFSLSNGYNYTDLNGDGDSDLIFTAARNNYNAHSFTQFSFFIHYTDTNTQISSPKWVLVPFYDEHNNVDDNLTTREGADGNLRDIRVLYPDSGVVRPAKVIIGRRHFGETYADKEPVWFVVYRLTSNEAEIPGWPTFYFEKEYVIRGKNNHTDINEAFLSELGIP